MSFVQANPLISVIVPVYKVEDYLERCVDSILIQTYRNLEIILVDDGSPDNCPIICDEYTRKDNRIRVIHRENGGLSEARNSGLDVAKGEFISFVDSDDAVHPQFIESLYKGIVQTGSDFAVCGFQSFSEESEIKTDFSSHEVYSYAGTDLLNGSYNIEYIVAWNKLYKKEIWQNLRYPKGKYHEDEFVFHLVFYSAKKICRIKLPLYYYFRRENSIMTSKGDMLLKRKTDLLEAEGVRLKFSKRHGLDTLYDVTYKRKMRTLFFILDIVHLRQIPDKIKQEVKLDYWTFTKKHQLKILLIRFFPFVLSTYRKLKSITSHSAPA
ncbi:glycosyltransferase family 2 protein [Parapedobacter indicus]|uniref:Glycosyltransferase involved in cell wall bisynthesis n=1 Tax=Parapedobacter indicus TaxID=1477437 RepID=A0A1I3QUT2_9SPHI|nr:glycosyltransferase family 2 protein [Parapedobacter indicus]PPL00253.1 glycosyltransferase involved in cell wall biosynthesis [Parapedobacter indicus]SFJ37848.1 Glycosyltransferase involved in cell wall bisynthesis [Parapedobacter indicus]